MSLLPRLSVTLGSKRYDSHVARARVELGALPSVNAAELVFPRGVPIDAAAGDPADLSMDGGDGAVPVMTGTIAALHRGPDASRVTLGDAGALLARLRPAATYSRQTFADVIARIAGDAGVDTADIAGDGDAPSVILHQGRTAAEWVAWLADLDGTIATIDGDGRLAVRERGDRPEMALLHGREPIRLSAGGAAVPADARLRIGFGPAGNVGAPDAQVPSVTPLPGGGSPGAGARWMPTPLLRTPGAAEAASGAATGRALAGATRLDTTTFLLPAYRPGQVIEVQSLPEGIAGGPWLLTHVRHRIDRHGRAETRLQGVGTGGGDLLAGLIGAAAGAIGALL